MSGHSVVWVGSISFTWIFHVLDLFEKMVPVSVQQSLAVFSQRKADLVNRSIAQMREATTLANG